MDRSKCDCQFILHIIYLVTERRSVTGERNVPLRGVILLSDVVALLWAEAERAKKSQSHVTDNYLPTENYSYGEKRP